MSSRTPQSQFSQLERKSGGRGEGEERKGGGGREGDRGGAMCEGLIHPAARAGDSFESQGGGLEKEHSDDKKKKGEN